MTIAHVVNDEPDEVCEIVGGKQICFLKRHFQVFLAVDTLNTVYALEEELLRQSVFRFVDLMREVCSSLEPVLPCTLPSLYDASVLFAFIFVDSRCD